MQIIYAAPFVLLSIVGFAVCIAVIRLRPFAIRVLFVPVSFGVFSLFGWIVFALSEHLLNFQLNSRAALLLALVLFYFLPGFLGCWLVISILKVIEKRFLDTPATWQRVIRIVISLIWFVVVSLIVLAVTGSWSRSGHLIASSLTSLVCGLSASVASYFLSRRIQPWPNTPSDMISADTAE